MAHVTVHDRIPPQRYRPSASDFLLWAEVRKNLRLAEDASRESRRALSWKTADWHMQRSFTHSVRALAQASALVGQNVGSLVEVRRLLEERGLM